MAAWALAYAMELCTAAMYRIYNVSAQLRLRRPDAACGQASRFRLRACGSRTNATVRQGRTDELPFQEHGTGRSLYPADKVSIAVPSRSV